MRNVATTWTARSTGIVWIACAAAAWLAAPPSWSAPAAESDAGGENLVVGGDFEQADGERPVGFAALWTRAAGAGRAEIDSRQPHGGARSVRIEHTGTDDWSLHQQRAIKVAPGEIYELSGWVRLEGEGEATLCVTLRGEQDRVLDWSFGDVSTRRTDGWRELRRRFVIPPGGATVVARWLGHGPATVWLDDMQLRRAGSLDQLRGPNLPKTLEATGKTVRVAFDTRTAALALDDLRTGRRSAQYAGAPVVVLSAQLAKSGWIVKLLDAGSMARLDLALSVDPERPEVVVELSGQGAMQQPLAFPPPLTTHAGEWLILPVNEGIGYPVDDATLPEMYYHTYGGHGLCMGWYGQTDGRLGVMTIVETPDDAAVRLPRRDGRLCLAPEWLAQKGQFGPPRRLRYVLFDRGGYVAMCKRYRRHALQTGLLRTLSDKRLANPNVDLLVGAVNVWCWDRDAVGICREMQEAGIDRILWSNRAEPAVLERLNAMGVLTSRYDIYQDVMNPANFPKLRGVYSDWTTEAWPGDLVIDAAGQWERGWRVEGKDGQWYPCGVLCDRRALDYARRRIPEELKTHPYRCRFIDTTTASPWRECYHPDHPMTRSESRHWKMELLRYVSEKCGLVCGSETGHEAAVPVVHYFEGMMSLGPYRVPDAGRKMQQILDEVPDRVAKFQTGHFYRLPLWELVYHDCVVAQWYWGDYNNKLPAVWRRRDLFNALYGTPPMFMFTRALWQSQRDRFVESYRTAARVARLTGYQEMLSHEWLTEDHAVQRSEFAGGVRVTVNFDDRPRELPDGTRLESMACRVETPETLGDAARQ